MIDVRGGTTYSQPYLQIKTGNIVEHLGISNINIVTRDGGGVVGGGVSNVSTDTVVYQGTAYAPGTINSISAHFFVTSDNFGNFSRNYSY